MKNVDAATPLPSAPGHNGPQFDIAGSGSFDRDRGVCGMHRGRQGVCGGLQLTGEYLLYIGALTLWFAHHNDHLMSSCLFLKYSGDKDYKENFFAG